MPRRLVGSASKTVPAALEALAHYPERPVGEMHRRVSDFYTEVRRRRKPWNPIGLRVVTGYPAEGARVPVAGGKKKALHEIATFT
ncbi:MAG TPA: hypothetical protein VLK35_12405 [Methylomirabilota bacterium]|nr:hypothetical protein [Methylomirabilota bacterium]